MLGMIQHFNTLEVVINNNDLLLLLNLSFPITVRIPHLGGPVDDATLEMIVKPYLERIYELRGDDPQNISETELQLLMLEVKILVQVSHKVFSQ